MMLQLLNKQTEHALVVINAWSWLKALLYFSSKIPQTSILNMHSLCASLPYLKCPILLLQVLQSHIAMLTLRAA